MTRLLCVAFCALLPLTALADDAAPAPRTHRSRFGAGAEDPEVVRGVYRVLDHVGTPLQSMAIAFDRAQEGAFDRVTLRGRLRVLEGGDGGAFLFLNTAEYGVRGPAPFVQSWVEPNLRSSFAVGIDVHNPPSEEPFGPWGNYQGLPQREVSLHWDGREIVKRVAPVEFRGDWTDLEIEVHHVVGGAEVTVRLAGAAVYERFFVAEMMPYETRLAIGAGTRADATTEFDVTDLHFEGTEPAKPLRAPLHFEIFNHVLTDNQKTVFDAEVALPPADWAFGRVILTLEIHDAGPNWDEWDRCGHVRILDADGAKRDIVPFITSYRTPCHWKVDVTHFRPYLAGTTRMEVEAGTNFYKNRGYMMSVSLDYYHGAPELEPYRVVPLWVGTAHYRSAENHFQDFFEPQTVEIEENARAARVFTTTTGHSQIGEFTPSSRTLVFAPVEGSDAAEEQRFENVLWKTDCYLNPNRPQYGTWKFSRAGWAPGDVVRPWWTDLTPWLQPGKTVELRYEATPYDFSEYEQGPEAKQIHQASHIVRSYLILYREPTGTMAPPTLRITGVANDSNAAKAGMKAGDYLTRYDGRPVHSLEELRAALTAALEAEKETVVVVVYRGTERLELELAAGRMGIGLAE